PTKRLARALPRSSNAAEAAIAPMARVRKNDEGIFAVCCSMIRVDRTWCSATPWGRRVRPGAGPIGPGVPIASDVDVMDPARRRTLAESAARQVGQRAAPAA